MAASIPDIRYSEKPLDDVALMDGDRIFIYL